MIFLGACDLDMASGAPCGVVMFCLADSELSLMSAMLCFCSMALASGLRSFVRDPVFDFFWILGALEAFVIPEAMDEMFVLGLYTSIREAMCNMKRSPSPRLSIQVPEWSGTLSPNEIWWVT
jgi:hypothetical protein